MPAVAEAYVMPETFTGIKVIDIDTHFTEPADLWTSRAPAAYKGMVPYVKRTNGVDQWYFNDQVFAPVGYTVITPGRKKKYGMVTQDSFEEVDVSTFDAKERLKLMDDTGIWGQVVFPNVAGFGGGAVARLAPADNRNECLRIYNDYMAEWAAPGKGRLRPMALIPFWDVKEVVREIARAHSLGLRGIAAMAAPENWGGDHEIPDYGDRHWDPMWEVCTALKMPICFHVGTGMLTDGPNAWKSFGFDGGLAVGAGRSLARAGSRQMAPIAAGVPTGLMGNGRVMGNLIFSGLLDRWPELKFVSVESGLGWIPFFLEAIDYQFSEMTFPDDRWGLQLKPSDYFRRNWYCSYWFEEQAVEHAIDFVGAQSILWETDFPHPVCLYPSPLERAAVGLAKYPYEVRKQIMQDNAAKLWDFPV